MYASHCCTRDFPRCPLVLPACAIAQSHQVPVAFHSRRERFPRGPAWFPADRIESDMGSRRRGRGRRERGPPLQWLEAPLRRFLPCHSHWRTLRQSVLHAVRIRPDPKANFRPADWRHAILLLLLPLQKARAHWTSRSEEHTSEL